jgi:DNA-binding SARP family transcriptional activator
MAIGGDLTFMKRNLIARATEHEPTTDTEVPAEPFQLRLMGGFDLRLGGQIVPLPLNARRVLALLAVRERPQTRTGVAFTLWMDTTQSRALANLRSTLWKIGPEREQLIRGSGERLWLAPHVDVDFARVVEQAKRLIGPDTDLSVDDANVDELAGELLPEWDEEWLRDEQERLRQLRVHALEALCSRLGNGGRGAEAVCAGQAAVSAEPLRESAQLVLINAHLAEGNVFEARRQFEIYQGLLWRNLQILPSERMTTLLAGALAGH